MTLVTLFFYCAFFMLVEYPEHFAVAAHNRQKVSHASQTTRRAASDRDANARIGGGMFARKGVRSMGRLWAY